MYKEDDKIFEEYGFTAAEIMGYAEFKANQEKKIMEEPVLPDRDLFATLQSAEEKISNGDYTKIIDIAIHTR